MYWVNGQSVDSLPLTDRGLHYGDGFFSTIRVKQGRIQLMTYHMQRLRHAATVLLLTSGIDWQQLQQDMQRFAAQIDDGVFKIILTRSRGGRGYSPAINTAAVTTIFAVLQLPDYTAWRDEGIELVVSSFRLARQPHLAGIKHLNRLEQVLIRAELDQREAKEGIVTDTQGIITECCSANLFWRRGHVVFTPLLDQAGVQGVMRQYIIHLLRHSNYQVTEVQQPIEALNEAEEIVICNTLMPVIPVNKVNDWRYNSHTLYHYLLPRCLATSE